MAQLAGWPSGARLAQDQVWAKPPGAPPLVFHRDSPYFDFSPADVVTVWLALDEMRPALGPLELPSGSRKHGSRKQSGVAHSSVSGSSTGTQRLGRLATHLTPALAAGEKAFVLPLPLECARGSACAAVRNCVGGRDPLTCGRALGHLGKLLLAVLGSLLAKFAAYLYG